MKVGLWRLVAALAGCALATTVAAPARADATRDAQWHLGFLHATEAQRISQGEGVTVGLIDSGVDANHPDLQGTVLSGIDAWSANKDGRTDAAGHGTAMASLIAGHGHGQGGRDGVLGIAPKAKILPVGVQALGSETYTEVDLAAGIRWAVDHGAQILCLALSGSSDPLTEQAVKYADSKGVTVVAGVGNRPKSSVVGFPAGYPSVIAVSAIGRDGNFASSVSVSGREVSFAAPGVEITSARAVVGTYGVSNGTSDSTAIVVGVLALLKSKFPNLTKSQLYQRLKATAIDKGPPGHDEQYGWGVIDPLAALTKDLGDGAGASATASPGDTSVAAPVAGRSTATKVLLTAVAIVGFLSVLALSAAVVVWYFRRRRRTAAGPAADLPPSGDGTPSPPIPPPDPTHWQRPPADRNAER
jgi:type VII secretion-associated serine protease mycosin